MKGTLNLCAIDLPLGKSKKTLNHGSSIGCTCAAQVNPTFLALTKLQQTLCSSWGGSLLTTRFVRLRFPLYSAMRDQGRQMDDNENSFVFFSYVRDDHEVTYRIADELKARGIRSWIDLRDIPAGADWSIELREKLHAAAAIIWIKSPRSAMSTQVLSQLKLAKLHSQQIIPVEIEASTHWEPKWAYFTLLQAVSFDDPAWGDRVAQRVLTLDGFASALFAAPDASIALSNMVSLAAPKSRRPNLVTPEEDEILPVTMPNDDRTDHHDTFSTSSDGVVGTGEVRTKYELDHATVSSVPSTSTTNEGTASQQDSVDFFISYTKADQLWAEWIAWKVEEAGYSTLIQSWDITPGRDWVHEMQLATSSARRTIVVLSPEYLRRSDFGEAEWRAAFAADPSGETATLIPIRVVECTPTGLLKTRVYIDLVGTEGTVAANLLLAGLRPGRAKPSVEPRFPSRVRGKLPAIPLVDPQTLFDNDGAEPLPYRRVDPSIEASARGALERLLALQYPWGEWSDHRTELESRIAERQPRSSMEVPKPNVARTLFSLEATAGGTSNLLAGSRRNAIDWMVGGLSDGWYWEWQMVATPHSESTVPELRKRADIRHTAQVASAIARWGKAPDPLGGLVRSISGSAISESGFWGDTPGSNEPRILATVYAVEALGCLSNRAFGIGFDEILDANGTNQARSALRRGLGALLSDVETGDGLLGAANGRRANPYISSLALLRLGPLAHANGDADELVAHLVNGLQQSSNEWGWEDESVNGNLRPLTRNRTTLRAAAALARTASIGVSVPPHLIDLVLSRAIQLASPTSGSPLDSPDLACCLICISALYPSISLDEYASEPSALSKAMRAQNTAKWAANTEKLLKGLSFGRELGIAGYDQAWREVSAHLAWLSS